MKLIITSLFTLTTALAFAQATPAFTINDEAFREVIESSLQRSPYGRMMEEGSTVTAVAKFENKTCSLQLEVKGKNSSFSLGLTQTAKNVEKCKEKIAKTIEKSF